MEFCTACGTLLPQNATACPHCGKPLLPVPAETPPPQPLQLPVYAQPFPGTGAPPRGPEPPFPPGSPRIPPRPHYAVEPDPAMTTGGYLVTLLLFLIPLAGLVLQIVWSFDKGTQPERQRLARAYLIRSLIVGAFSLVVFVLVCALSFTAVSAFSNMTPYYFY